MRVGGQGYKNKMAKKVGIKIKAKKSPKKIQLSSNNGGLFTVKIATIVKNHKEQSKNG